MIPSATIGMTFLAALCAGLVCWALHPIANRHRWRFVHRCVAGVTIICAAFVAPLFTALPIETAAALELALVVIAAAAGLGTWLNYQHRATDPTDDASATPDADAVLQRLENELDQ